LTARCTCWAAGKPTPAYLPKVARLVAIGDLHGDIQKTHAAFRIAGLANSEGHWTGGTTTVVQVGDQLDRGGNEVAILYFLERMQAEAARAGGAVHWINGNHETLNVAARFRYATHEVRVRASPLSLLITKSSPDGLCLYGRAGTCISCRVPPTSNDGTCFSWWAPAFLYTPCAASLSPDLPRAARSPLRRGGVPSVCR
jgi:hypothetical protein